MNDLSDPEPHQRVDSPTPLTAEEFDDFQTRFSRVYALMFTYTKIDSPPNQGRWEELVERLTYLLATVKFGCEQWARERPHTSESGMSGDEPAGANPQWGGGRLSAEDVADLRALIGDETTPSVPATPSPPLAKDADR